MANALYSIGRENFLTATVDWASDTIHVMLVDTASYSVSLASDDFIADIASAMRIANKVLASKTTSAGVADAADTVLSSVSGAQSEALVLYKNTSSASTDNLIAYIDSATGLPVTPNGGDITIAWDAGANKIFKL